MERQDLYNCTELGLTFTFFFLSQLSVALKKRSSTPKKLSWNKVGKEEINKKYKGAREAQGFGMPDYVMGSIFFSCCVCMFVSPSKSMVMVVEEGRSSKRTWAKSLIVYLWWLACDPGRVSVKDCLQWVSLWACLGGTILSLLWAAPFPGQGNLNYVRGEKQSRAEQASKGAFMHSFPSALDCGGHRTAVSSSCCLPYWDGL